MDIDPLRLTLAGSSVALTALVIVWSLYARRRIYALAGAAALAAVLWWIYSATFPSRAVQTRGDAEIAVLVISYVSMVLGMMAHYIYEKREHGATRLTIEWLPFLAPILVSPIVFIPLVTIAGEVDGGAISRAALMVYLVAFQNGFFWKHFFDQRRPTLAAPTAAARV